MPDEDSANSFLAGIAAEQQRLRDLLAGEHEARLAERPPNGKWSVLENVRHLLFAEQVHLGGFTADGRWKRSLALPAHEMRQARQLLDFDGTPLSTVAEAFDAWDALAARTREVTKHDTEAVRHALAGNLRHLRGHIAVIERLLRARQRAASTGRPSPPP